MTNFDFLQQDKEFSIFSETAITAEKIYSMDTNVCVATCRQAMEFAIKWMYSVDKGLKMPYKDTLVTLMNTKEFKSIISNDVYKKIDYIRKLGNIAIHNPRKKYTKDEAALALENLFCFCNFVYYSYSDLNDYYVVRKFDKSLLEQSTLEMTLPEMQKNISTLDLMNQNVYLQDNLTARRKEQSKTYNSQSLDLTEFSTRKLYINTMLENAGWSIKNGWVNEYEVQGMPNKSGIGYIDYVLFGDDGKPLAIIEAKRTSKDVSAGRQQAKLYADIFENKFDRRPIIFLTNGFETKIWNDKYYPEREVSSIYSKRDLEKEYNILNIRSSLDNIWINDDISNRYYQKEAIKNVCEDFEHENKRKALLVMATGSGKTRTVISLVDVLIRHGWIKNVLFLADRNSLVTQAKRAFANLLPNISATNLVEEKNNLTARCVFSTYQTMISCIDDAKDDKGERLFTCGHFDLVICDEAHRSIYNKYKDIFNYFDSFLVGLTATPKYEIDHNTYDVFELEDGVPTYGYELSQAVTDGYLVDFVSVETSLKFMTNGIVYDELSDFEKEEYEEKFVDENGDIPDKIENKALNDWLFNKNTIKEALAILMEKGIKIDSGNKLGKTIIFAKNHLHAEKILEIFNQDYPHYTNYCSVIDNYINYSQSLIDQFSEPNQLPQIAISVDMMDTGIDVPECVNLVFFKRVLSKAKFWQMIGRGTRICEGLIDGNDKEVFYIFDFCQNFEFFRMGNKGRDTYTTKTIQEQLFNLNVELCYKLSLQDCLDTGFIEEYYQSLIVTLVEQLQKLNRDNFSVRQHLRYVEQYSKAREFNSLSFEKVLLLRSEVAPLIEASEDEINALRFDSLVFAVELSILNDKSNNRAKNEIIKRIKAVSKMTTIPEVVSKNKLIKEILHTDYLERAGIEDWEFLRKELRNLMVYIPKEERIIYTTTFIDKVLNIEWNESELFTDELINYKEKARHYILENMNHAAITKLVHNETLNTNDIQGLEEVLWEKIGSKEEYEAAVGSKSLGLFVREITGLSIRSAKEAFSKYLNDENLNSKQIHFINQLIEYIVKNGTVLDKTVLQEAPFTDYGSFTNIFDDETIIGVLGVVDQINSNARI